MVTKHKNGFWKNLNISCDIVVRAPYAFLWTKAPGKQTKRLSWEDKIMHLPYWRYVLLCISDCKPSLFKAFEKVLQKQLRDHTWNITTSYSIQVVAAMYENKAYFTFGFIDTRSRVVTCLVPSFVHFTSRKNSTEHSGQNSSHTQSREYWKKKHQS